jgi:hypothetical protein
MSTVVKRSTSASVRRGLGEKKRKYSDWDDSPAWKRRNASASDGRMGRTCTVAAVREDHVGLPLLIRGGEGHGPSR